MLEMATSEVEDLAALVGIEILPECSNNDVTDSNGGNVHGELADLPSEKSPNKDSLLKLETSSDLDSEIMALCSADRLSRLEEELADRYTQHDKEFASTRATPVKPPPCVTPFWSNDRGDRFRGRGGRDRGRGWGRGPPNNRDFRDRDQWQHRDNRYQGQGRDWDNRYQGQGRDWDNRYQGQGRDWDNRYQGQGRDWDNSRRYDNRREDRGGRQHRDRSQETRDRY